MLPFLSLDFFRLGLSHRIPQKSKNAGYHLQISALVADIFKFEKCVKYANEMTDNVIHSTQYYSKYILSYLDQFAAETMLKFGKLIGLHAHTYGYKNFRSHSNTLFFNPI